MEPSLLPGPEIQAYFEDVARRYGVDQRIRFGTEITSCRFGDGRWTIEADDGTSDHADFIIAATGVLHHPQAPEFEGADTFEGAMFHSARWDHDVPLKGKRVGVVGTGSTAIQIVSAIIDDVASLAMFQRTPQWVMPVDNPAYTDVELTEFREQPEKMQAVRDEMAQILADTFSNALVDASSPALQMIHDACVANLETNVHDPELRERLRPDYRATCKRLVMSPGFYDAIQRPNATLVTSAIERLEPTGARTKDGTLHELDVLVLATGFKVDAFTRPMQVFGRNGVSLDAVWEDGPFAYLAITVPDFPNFFMLNGPNGPVGNFSLIDVAELEFGYIMQLIEQVRSGACTELNVSATAAARFDDARKAAAKNTIWASGCRSWYLDKHGIPTAWPWTFDRFREEMAAPKFVDYETR